MSKKPEKPELTEERILMLHQFGRDNWACGIEGVELESAVRRSPDYGTDEARLVMDGWVYCEVTFRNSIRTKRGEGK